jgi:hypothetical protein
MSPPKAPRNQENEVVICFPVTFLNAKVPLWLVLLLLWFVLLLQQHAILGSVMQPVPLSGKNDGKLVAGYIAPFLPLVTPAMNFAEQGGGRVPPPLPKLPRHIKESSTHVTTCQTNEPRRPRSHASNVTQYATDEYSLQKSLEDEIARANSFSKIYETGAWGGGEVINGVKFGGSGPGSLMSSTEKVRKTLDVIINVIKDNLGKERIRVLDMPCGDMVWMRHYLDQRTDVDYTGMDIVGSLIDHHNNVLGGEHPSWKFEQHDIVNDPLQERYDLIFSRQMTQHLGTEDTMRVLQHFSDGGKFLLITNYPQVYANIPLNTGTEWRFRQQNFLIEPYRLIEPICEGDEDGTDAISFYQLPLLQWH